MERIDEPHSSIRSTNVKILARPIEEPNGNRGFWRFGNRIFKIGAVRFGKVTAVVDYRFQHLFLIRLQLLGSIRKEASYLANQTDGIVAYERSVDKVNAKHVGPAKCLANVMHCFLETIRFDVLVRLGLLQPQRSGAS
jgi:hypothetical protein